MPPWWYAPFGPYTPVVRAIVHAALDAERHNLAALVHPGASNRWAALCTCTWASRAHRSRLRARAAHALHSLWA